MSYATIQPPFSLNLREMPKGELKRYFRWFMNMLPERVDELAKAVKRTPGFETWQPDFTPPSLGPLEDWFAEQVESRNRNHEEIQAIRNRQVSPIDVPGEDLTNRTFSLAMDVGMYLSQVLLNSYPSLQWDQPLANKRFADYGQPVLSGFGPVSLNPVRVAVTSAYALASKKKNHKSLREIYDYWAQRVQPPGHLK
jgi:hypothetical protein